jgi:hypothetical protein
MPFWICFFSFRLPAAKPSSTSIYYYFLFFFHSKAMRGVLGEELANINRMLVKRQVEVEVEVEVG